MRPAWFALSLVSAHVSVAVRDSQLAGLADNGGTENLRPLVFILYFWGNSLLSKGGAECVAHYPPSPRPRLLL